ncbi:hypothetical protein B0H19DRAFT_1067474 [Mycena capillaripes]|nr:hypothetical protein B0H19DRAFT_1067474 [Mycena capillaripes]
MVVVLPLHPLLPKPLTIMGLAVPTSSLIRKLSSKQRNQPTQVMSSDTVRLIKDLNANFARPVFSPVFEVHNILSSSTGKNTEGHMEVYLAAVQKYGFTNMLLEFLQQQADKQCIVNAQRVPLSMAAFREQLVKLPPCKKSTDMVGYWMVQCPNF